MKIRFANPQDVDALLELNALFNGDGCTTREKAAAALGADRPEKIVIAFDEDGTPAGFACAQWLNSFCYQDDFAQLTELYVRPEYRRQGTATMLVAFLEEHCKKHGIHEIQLTTGESNKDARAFYEKMGYLLEQEAVYQKDLDD